MEIGVEIEGLHASVVLAGRLDAAWSNAVGEALDRCIREGVHQIGVDLAAVSFLSSGGIRVLLAARKQLARIDGTLKLERPSAAVVQILELSGLSALLSQADLEPVTAAASSPLDSGTTPKKSGEDAAPPEVTERAGARIESWPGGRVASLRVHTLGDPDATLAGRANKLIPWRFPAGSLGLGHGAFGSDATECRVRVGEFLAVAGVASTLPADEAAALPDWVAVAGDLVPEIFTAAALVVTGEPDRLVRFEVPRDTAPMGLAMLAEIALARAGTPLAVIVLVAEAAQLVGAALRRPPLTEMPLLRFPEIRDNLTFTAEPAWADSLALVVGVVGRGIQRPLARFLRPLEQDSNLMGHLHAGVFPHRPIRRGRVTLDEIVVPLFEERAPRTLLHLLHDWRQPFGAGESRFRRGLLFTAPLEQA